MTANTVLATLTENLDHHRDFDRAGSAKQAIAVPFGYDRTIEGERNSRNPALCGDCVTGTRYRAPIDPG